MGKFESSNFSILIHILQYTTTVRESLEESNETFSSQNSVGIPSTTVNEDRSLFFTSAKKINPRFVVAGISYPTRDSAHSLSIRIHDKGCTGQEPRIDRETAHLVRQRGSRLWQSNLLHLHSTHSPHSAHSPSLSPSSSGSPVDSLVLEIVNFNQRSPIYNTSEQSQRIS